MLRHSHGCATFAIALCIAAPLLAQDDPFHGFDPFAEPAAVKKDQPQQKPAAAPAPMPVVKVKLLGTSSAPDPSKRPLYAISQGLPTYREPLAVQKIRQTLKRHVDISMTMVPLIDFAEAVEKAIGINVWLDQPLLEGVGIGIDDPITLNIKGVSLESALRLVLKDMGLTFMIRDEVLQITTPEEACDWLITKVYRIEDLLQHSKAEPGKGPSALQFERQKAKAKLIVELLTTAVAAGSWDDVGGPGAIDHLFIRDRCLLIISQHPTIHQQIAMLLETLRNAALPEPREGKTHRQKAEKSTAAHESSPVEKIAQPSPLEYFDKHTKLTVKMLPPATMAVPRNYVGISQGLAIHNDSPAIQKIEQALKRRVNIHATKTPLHRFVVALRRATGLNVLIDTPALARYGVGPKTPVSGDFQNLTLQSSLRWILEPLGATFVVREEGLQITADDFTECYGTVCRIYRIEDLLERGKDAGHTTAKESWIIDVLETTVAPWSWNDVGGPGITNVVWIRDRCLLFIWQEPPVHLEIAGLLETLREAALPAPVAKNKQPVAKPDAIEEPPEPLPTDDALNQLPAPIQQVAAGRENINRKRKVLVRMLPQQVAQKPSAPYAEISRGVTLIKPSAAERKIEAVLDAAVAVDFLLTPLSDVARDVATAAGINVLLDKDALAGIGISPETPVTRSVAGVRLRSALEQILREMDLAFIIQNDVLKITTREEMDSVETTRLYPIEDFAPRHLPNLYADDLADLITTTVSPEAWEHSGPSIIYDVTFNGHCFIVVPQMPWVHRQIADLLKTIRRAVYEL